MAERQRDASDAVLAWLRAQGYPLEMRVAQILRARGWNAQHAVWYEDPETSKLRELDLVASISAGPIHPLSESATLELAIECKSSPNKPWVALESPQTEPSLEGLSFVDGYSHDVWMVCAERLAMPSIARVVDKVSHGVVRAHADNRSGDPTAPFAAIQSVMSAASAIGRKHAELALDTKGAAPGAVLIVPIVVLDGMLFQYSMDAAGNEYLSEVPHAAIRVPSSGWFGQATIRIVTFDGLADLLRELTPSARTFVEGLAPIAKDVFTSLKSRVVALGRDQVVGKQRR